MAQLDRCQSCHISLNDSTVFNYILQKIAAEMHTRHGETFTNDIVKCCTFLLKNRFNAFVKFIELLRVNDYNRQTTLVSVDQTYVTSAKNKNKAERALHNFFVANGFPYYDTCELVFVEKKAGAIEFSDKQGFDKDDNHN
ncbi:PREDICTED: uncharacterized protein LOC105965701 [Erythranthe guttata]|uniref:uncharacterized protein LOC105965701 n=1 Tax=Erythranthe guttata TaxID=4155 RepID=UPI00064DF189|nr:PREDICTED: uncharacterized protein LOC105965701 [Erythranthe guttata]|eukprot:XP_012845726.1 PREDICTED: uncharacterized protein LOC105965701 [Erythranthe guttata]